MIKVPIFACAFILMTTTASLAESRNQEPQRPTDSDLLFYFTCSEVATQRPLNFDEAVICTEAFQRIKLSFLPGVLPADYEALGPAERAAVNRVGYERYREWSLEHAREVEALRHDARSALVLAVD